MKTRYLTTRLPKKISIIHRDLLQKELLRKLLCWQPVNQSESESLMLSLLILLLLAAATSLSLTDAVRHYAVRTALLDLPNERSSHTQPTPRGGGLGFIIAFAVTSTLTSVLTSYFPQLLPTDLATPNLSCLWLILTPLAITGILDDRHSLPAALRYLVQLAAAGIALTCFGPFPQP